MSCISEYAIHNSHPASSDGNRILDLMTLYDAPWQANMPLHAVGPQLLLATPRP